MGVERMVRFKPTCYIRPLIRPFRIPDLSLTIQHPKRAFMRRALEFEIRLSYHDRILKTLPEDMQAPDAHTIGEQAPGPDFEYDDPGMFFVL
jgi:hypothetical protein